MFAVRDILLRPVQMKHVRGLFWAKEAVKSSPMGVEVVIPLIHQPMDHLRKEFLGLVLKPMHHHGSAKHEYGFHLDSPHSVTHNQAQVSLSFSLENGSNLVTSGESE
jgi:hypothetical protein